MALPNPALDLRICNAVAAQIGAAYAVVGPIVDVQYHRADGPTISYRAEATFRVGSLLTGTTFKIQTSRTLDDVGSATSLRWTDLALRNAASPDAVPVVEWDLALVDGLVRGLDLFSDQAHRGRSYLRVLVKRTGGGAASGADAFALYVSDGGR